MASTGIGTQGRGALSPRAARAQMEEALGKLDISEEEATPLIIDDTDEGLAPKWLLAGKVLYQNLLHIQTITNALRPTWGNPKGLTFRSLGENMFAAEFDTKRDRDRVWDGSPWHISKHAVILKDFEPHIQPSELKFDRLQFCTDPTEIKQEISAFYQGLYQSQGDTGEEAVLNTLWQRYENAIDKAEKKKSLQIFVLHFIQAFKDWEPHHIDQSIDRESVSDDTVIGCSGGHPSEVILILVQEISHLTSFVTESSSCPESSANLSEQSTDLGLSTEVLPVLEWFTIVTRSVHNCRVFSYYGGVQKVTALLKAAVVKLKTLTSLLATDEQLSNRTVENMRMMQKILVYIVTIISNFMDLEPAATRISQVANSTDHIPSNNLATVTPNTTRRFVPDRNWQQKAIVSVMEAGGVNWLVELLRVIRRLNLKDQWTDLSLHFITLYALRSTISENTRAQNHFRSIGGLEVLLDGLGLPSSKFSVSKHSFVPSDERSDILQLQILSLEILREAVYPVA
ncbi:BEACH domain-containing protein lvsC [Hordeum vulgare]|nr:BEACH domain-containing protein lvsC [Hordeum vulgare]